MKRSKKFITLLSLAAIGLTSTPVLAQSSGVGTEEATVDKQIQQIQQRLREHIGDVKLSPELEEAIVMFREQRRALMEQFRALREAHRAEMADLWQALREAKAEENPDAIAAAELAIKEKIEEFRAENGDDIKGLRDARQGLREAKRQLREQIRTERPETDGDG